ncbi:hypothetical protein [Methylobacterium sp. CCH5-D2]|uniref:hypothetical protein n=1 Tax=Methylobacterium sp. CCH5-D2 TaxID=1768765 RepID=UPI00082BFC6D|nr:hypothetical protein [Methylobacterium sp. CCH5-D2]
MDRIELPGKPRRGRAARRDLSPNDGTPPAAPHSEIGASADREAGHCSDAPHRSAAGLAPHSEIVSREAGEGEVGPSSCEPQVPPADLADQIAELREQWRRRQAWHRAEKALTLQAKALCRRLAEGGDKAEADRIYGAAYGKGSHPLADIALAATFPLTEARDSIAKHRAAVEKRLVKLAKALPVAPWVEGTRGVGLLSLAAIVGEAGDLGAYANPAKLWKRMGLAIMPDGRQRRTTGAAALDHGYSPARRSVVWNIGACIMKAGGPLKEIYDARKLYELPRVETKGHAHNRAQRYVEKRFLRLLWCEWRKGGGDHRGPDTHRTRVASVTPIPDAA